MILSLKRLAAAFALALLPVACAAPPPPGAIAPAERPLTLLISIDAFRTDYLDRGLTPNLSALAAGGAHAAALKPAFPTLTFPNHYTLVTGLTPDHHGIVANAFYDPRRPAVRFYNKDGPINQDSFWWDAAEPVWTTAERHGLRSAVLFWPGDEAEIHGARPHDWKPFDKDMGSDARVATVLGWLDRPAAERPRFLALYLDEIDVNGHSYGPDAPELDKALTHVDAAIGTLVAGLRARGIAANIVVVSDHGMAKTSATRTIYTDQLLRDGTYRVVYWGPMAAIDPTPGNEATVDAALLRPLPHMQCWRRDAMPARFRYGRNPRIARIQCLADIGWRLWVRGQADSHPEGGDHGYDNDAPEMRGLFIANGPAFRPGTQLPEFANVDVYPLVMRLLGLKPRANDGSIAPIEPALAP